VSGFVALLNIAIPQARQIRLSNDTIHFDLYCGNNFYLERSLEDEDKDCFFRTEEPVSILTMEVQNCGYICPIPVIQYPEELHDNLKNLTIPIRENPWEEYACRTSAHSHMGVQKCYVSKHNSSVELVGDATSFTLHKV